MMRPYIEKLAPPLRDTNGRFHPRRGVHFSRYFVLDNFVGFGKALFDIPDFLLVHQDRVRLPGGFVYTVHARHDFHGVRLCGLFHI